jgi:hypothetical protein
VTQITTSGPAEQADFAEDSSALEQAPGRQTPARWWRMPSTYPEQMHGVKNPWKRVLTKAKVVTSFIIAQSGSASSDPWYG